MYSKDRCLRNIDFGRSVNKSDTKTTQDIVKSLCVNLLNIKKKLFTQGLFDRNIFVVVTFFTKFLFFSGKKIFLHLFKYLDRCYLRRDILTLYEKKKNCSLF